MTATFAGTLQNKRPSDEKLRKRQQQIGEPWKKQRPARKLRKKQRGWSKRHARGAHICHVQLQQEMTLVCFCRKSAEEALAKAKSEEEARQAAERWEPPVMITWVLFGVTAVLTTEKPKRLPRTARIRRQRRMQSGISTVSHIF